MILALTLLVITLGPFYIHGGEIPGNGDRFRIENPFVEALANEEEPGMDFWRLDRIIEEAGRLMDENRTFLERTLESQKLVESDDDCEATGIIIEDEEIPKLRSIISEDDAVPELRSVESEDEEIPELEPLPDCESSNSTSSSDNGTFPRIKKEQNQSLYDSWDDYERSRSTSSSDSLTDWKDENGYNLRIKKKRDLLIIYSKRPENVVEKDRMDKCEF